MHEEFVHFYFGKTLGLPRRRPLSGQLSTTDPGRIAQTTSLPGPVIDSLSHV